MVKPSAKVCPQLPPAGSALDRGGRPAPCTREGLVRSCTWEVRGCWAWGETWAQPSTRVLDGVRPLGRGMAGRSPGSAGPGRPAPALQKARPSGTPPPVTSGGGAVGLWGLWCLRPGALGWGWVPTRAEQSGSLSPAAGEQGGASLPADPSQGS